VRQLGDMSSGIDSYTTDDTVTSEYFANPRKAWAPEDRVAAATALPRRFPPGRGFPYSNTNFLMLGMIVEKVTGMPVGTAMQAMTFDRLGLDRTSYPGDTRMPSPYWHGYTDQGTSDGRARRRHQLEPDLRRGRRSDRVRPPRRAHLDQGARHRLAAGARNPAVPPAVQPGICGGAPQLRLRHRHRQRPLSD